MAIPAEVFDDFRVRCRAPAGPERRHVWTWDPPKCGDIMPDGRSRIESVVIVCDTDRGASIEVGFSLAGQVRYRAWPCTNRRAKRERCKATRRRALWFREHLHEHYDADERRRSRLQKGTQS